jgi:hypothetical protein
VEVATKEEVQDRPVKYSYKKVDLALGQSRKLKMLVLSKAVSDLTQWSVFVTVACSHVCGVRGYVPRFVFSIG